MLTKCQIKRFKNISDFETDLSAMTVLIGGNNSGKSSVLQSIHFATSVIQSRRLHTKTLYRDGSNSFTISQEQLLYAPLTDIDALAPNRHLKQARASRIEISLIDDKFGQALIGVRRGKNANLAVQAEGKIALDRLSDITHPWSIYVPGLSGISRNESYVEFGLLRRAVARGDANLYLRNVLYRLNKDKGKWGEFVSHLKAVFPDFAIYFPSDPETSAYLEVEVTRHGTALPLDASGTGFLQTCMILSYIALFEPAIVLLDEPDSHLHPTNQRLLSNHLRAIAEQGKTQFIVATHSRHILDELRESAQIIWVRTGKSQAFEDELEVLSEIGALDKAEGLVSGKVPNVIFTEDENVRMMTRVVKAIGKEESCLIWPFKGCKNINLATEMSAFVTKIAPKANIVVHLDSDYYLPEDIEYLVKLYNSKHMRLFLTPGVDVEALFCSAEHLQEINPGCEVTVSQVCDEVIKQSMSELINEAKKGQHEVNNWRHKVGQGSKSAVEIQTWLDSINIVDDRWIKGKVMLPKLKNRFKEITNSNLKVMEVSRALNLRARSLLRLLK